LTTKRISAGLTYGDQKAVGAGRLSSDVVVYADPDCIYRRGWLNALLDTLAKHPEVGAVAGETTIPITGPFTLAVAFFYFFPRFSGQRTPAPARGFYFNNVAFRRRIVEEHPVDLGLPLRGGQNVIYARQLNAAGVPIMRQPLARCEHAPPEGLWMAMKILFWTGRDTARFDGVVPAHVPYSGDFEPYEAPGGRLHKLQLRTRAIARQQPFALAWLPVALPILGLVFGAFFAGRFAERWLANPNRQRADESARRRSPTSFRNG
jgi:hypothetical protein